MDRYTPKIPEEATACPQEPIVSPGIFTCFKVWTESKSSLYLCAPGSAPLVGYTKRWKQGEKPSKNTCEVSGTLQRCAWLQGYCQAWMLRDAGGTPELNYSCKCIPFLSQKGLFVHFLGVAGRDPWFSLQCNWLRFSSKNVGGFGPVFSAQETPGIPVFRAVFLWSQAGRVCSLQWFEENHPQDQLC